MLESLRLAQLRAAELLQQSAIDRGENSTEDSTELLQAQAELEKREDFLRRVADVTPGVIEVFDLDKQCTVFVNRCIRALLGYSTEDIESMGSGLVPALMHPEDLPRFAAHRQCLRSLGDHETADFEYRLRERSGGWRWMQNRDAVFARDAAGAVSQIIGNAVDISERKNAEEKIQRSEEFHRLTFDLSPMGMASADADTRFTRANQMFCDITGYPADELLRMKVSDLTHPDDLATNKVKIDLLHSGAVEKYDIEKRYIRKDGSICWVSVTVRMVRDASGQLLHSIGVIQDITERKRAEAAVAQNVGLFSRMLEQAPTGMYVVDAGFRLQQVNALAAPVFASIHPLIGRDFAEIMEILWGPMVGAQLTAIFRHTLASGERYVSPPFYERRFDVGEDQAFDWETQRVTLPDGQHGVVCYFHEITARQRAEMALRDSEERMRLATEATGVGIWQWNLSTDERRWDAQMFRIFGFAPTADGLVPYADWRGSVLPEDLAAQEEILRNTVHQIGSSRRVFRILRRDDGECRHIEAVVTVRKGAGGQVEWAVGTNLDVTERKLAEERIRALLEELRLADSRKDEFLATLAHELRNPLAAVRNSLELMKRGSGNAALMEQARSTMERQMAQMVHLIDDLLDVSRITHNRLELRLERVELASVVQHAVEAGRPHCQQAGHQLHVTLPPEPIILNADPMRLAQVFGNLLNNACKYTRRGGSIWLSAERQGNQVALTLKDSGVGIAPEMLHTVFELFTQIGSSLERSEGGLGIGLSLAKRLTELHGGTLTAHSAGPDQGSEFVVRLPVLLETASPAAPVPIAAPAPPTATRRILVVDDNRDAGETLAELLEMTGHQTQTAYDGAQAIESAAVFRPDVILLDIGMPKMNGYDACRAIRQQPWGKSILMIALTGWGQEKDHRKSLEAGFDHHLVKPVNFKQLLKLLAEPQALKA